MSMDQYWAEAAMEVHRGCRQASVRDGAWDEDAVLVRGS